MRTRNTAEPVEAVAPSVRQTTTAFQQGVVEALHGYRSNVAAYLDEPTCRGALLSAIADLVELERMDAARIDRQLRAKEAPGATRVELLNHPGKVVSAMCILNGCQAFTKVPGDVLDRLTTLEAVVAELAVHAPPPQPPARASSPRRKRRKATR